MTESRMSACELLDQMVWEGGYFDIIDYGVTHDQVPLEVCVAWCEMEGVARRFNELTVHIQEKLEELQKECDECDV